MPYIGNTVQNQGFTPAIDYFNGNGVTVTFTLSRPVASVAQMIVAIDNVIQNPSSAYSVSGNSITFTSAPLSGTNNIWVEYTSLITTYNSISQDPSVVGDITATGGFLSTGDFGNTYTDGTIVDYVTGNARITTGPADGITLYNGGPTARNALMTLASTGNVGIGITAPNTRLQVTKSNAGGDVGLLVSQDTNGYTSTSSTATLYLAATYNNTSNSSKIVSSHSDGTTGDHAQNMQFWTVNSGSTPTERFRIGAAGQFGIGGANYGASGQVLTSGGSGAAPSWAGVLGSSSQTWQNVTGSRSSGTTYTNSTGAPILVIVYGNDNPGQGFSLTFTVNGSTVGPSGQGGPTGGGYLIPHPIVVQPGLTYSTSYNASANYGGWWELR